MKVYAMLFWVMATFPVQAATLLKLDYALARADRAQFPRQEWGYLLYFTAGNLEGESQDDLIAAFKVMVASASTQYVVERATPIQLQDTPWIMRIDLRDVKWRYRDWRTILTNYDYWKSEIEATGTVFPLMVRADWMLLQLADYQESDAYYQLMFGNNAPSTRDEFLKLLGVSTEEKFRYGMIEGQSGVSKQGVRWIESYPSARGYAYGTRDILKVTAESDPLENPRGDFKHDGEEWIIGVSRISSATGVRGALQVYALADGDGKLVRRAKVDLVEDSTTFRGYREIRVPGSCMQCHQTGLNSLTENALRELIKSGVDVYAGRDDQQKLEAFHLGDLSKELKRNQEDYAVMIEAICGLKPVDFSISFKRAVDRYTAKLNLETAAQEVGRDPEDLRLALAYASSHTHVGARVAGLAHGKTVSRETWAERYPSILAYLKGWDE